MEAVFATLLLVTIANLALAGFVLWHRPQAEVNSVFALTALAVAGWTLTNALFQQTQSLEIANLAAQFSYLSAVVLGASFLHFSWVFPLRRTLPPRHKMLWAITLLVGLLPFAPGAVIRSISLSGNRSIDTASGIWLVALFMVASSARAFGGFVQRHRTMRVSDLSSDTMRSSSTTSGIGHRVGEVINSLLSSADGQHRNTNSNTAFGLLLSARRRVTKSAPEPVSMPNSSGQYD